MPVALTLVGGWKATITYVDVSQNSSSTNFHIAPAVTATDAYNYLNAVAQAIELLTDAKVLNASLSRLYAGSGSAAAVAGGNVEQKGVFGFRTFAGKTAIVTIPAPKIAKMKADERSLNEADADVAALVTLLITGDGTTEASDSNAQSLDELLYTKVRHRSSTVG